MLLLDFHRLHSKLYLSEKGTICKTRTNQTPTTAELSEEVEYFMKNHALYYITERDAAQRALLALKKNLFTEIMD